MFPILDSSPAIMEQLEAGRDGGITKLQAVIACTSMAVFYVAILYSPTLIFRLPKPNSFNSFMIRRFICAGVSSVVSVILCAFILPIRSLDGSHLFAVYGIRLDHIWQALVVPLFLTSFMYSGSFALKLLSMLQPNNEHNRENVSIVGIKSVFLKFIDLAVSNTSDISLWRNYIVAPLTEELVFRACMIPLLLCGGFTTNTIIFLCPVFFSLAHLNHLLEFYGRENYSLLKACTLVGFQLGYTVIFGAYASFLLVRTGHITAPLIAHMFCNFMGLPVMISQKSGIIRVVFLLGFMSFFWLLFPFTSPHLYNDKTDHCDCWHRYCNWS